MTTVTEIHPTHAWQRSMRDGIATVQELLEIVQVDANCIDAMQPAAGEFPLRVPRSYAARMRKGDPADPLLLQVLPLHAERMDVPGFAHDPLRETGLANQGVLKKYRGRALLVTTPACPVHCRYCFRRHFPYADQVAARDRWEPALRTLRGMTDVTEVILSGGDPLSLTNRWIGELLHLIEGLGHIDTVRFHTRFPIVLPERVDHGILTLLSTNQLRTVMVVHCNHANEIDSSVRAALEAVARTETVLLNQSVLLKGINDNADRLESLSRALFSCGVLPYYIHPAGPGERRRPLRRAGIQRNGTDPGIALSPPRLPRSAVGSGGARSTGQDSNRIAFTDSTSFPATRSPRACRGS